MGLRLESVVPDSDSRDGIDYVLNEWGFKVELGD